MRYREIIAEKLKLSTAREYRKAWNPDTYKELFAQFDAKYRIYIPFNEVKDPPRIPAALKLALKNDGYIITDYLKGIATDKFGKQSFKIGKLLTNYPSLLKKFTNDPQRDASKVKENKFIVISRHPYDIAGMSTDREPIWTSCMDLTNGSNRHYVMNDVKEGTLVAYLIRENDKNINNPLARISIKPYINVENSKDIILVTEPEVYGITSKNFREMVDEWVKDVNQDKEMGLYCTKDDVYYDGDETSLINIPRNIDFEDANNQIKLFNTFENMNYDTFENNEHILKSIIKRIKTIHPEAISAYFNFLHKLVEFESDEVLEGYIYKIKEPLDRKQFLKFMNIGYNVYQTLGYLKVFSADNLITLINKQPKFFYYYPEDAGDYEIENLDPLIEVINDSLENQMLSSVDNPKKLKVFLKGFLDNFEDTPSSKESKKLFNTLKKHFKD